MKLYEVTKAVEGIQEGVSRGEIDPQAATDTLESLFPVAKDKGKNLAAVVQNMESEVREMKAAEDRMAKRRKASVASIDWLKNYLLENMVALGWEEISCPEFVVKLANNPPKVEIDDDVEIGNLADDWVTTKVTKTPDKKALKAALESGIKIRGIRIVRGKRLKFA